MTTRPVTPHSRPLIFLAKKKMAVVPHHLYSPRLIPCVFALFLKMKLKLGGYRFDSGDIIQQEAQKVLDSFTENDYKKVFQDWQTRCDRCI